MATEPPADDVRSNEELVGAAAGGLRWIAYSRVGIELVLLAAMVLLARLIPPAAFGAFAIVVIVHELAVSLPMEGVGSAIVQRRSISRAHLEGGMLMTLAAGLPMMLLTLAVAALIVKPIFGGEVATLIAVTSPYFLIGAVYALPMTVLRRNLDFRRLSIVELSLNASRVAIAVALAIAGLDATALVLGSLGGILVALALALRFAPVPGPRWRPEQMRELLPYGGPAALATFAWAGFRNGDYAIVGATLGAAQAGLYWRAYQLAVEYQRKISVAMIQIAFPVLARTQGTDELHELRRRMVHLVTVAVFPLLACLALLAPTVIPWLFGSAWEDAVVPTQILTLGGVAALLADACGSALMALGRARALLGYGVAHFAAYATAVVIVAPYGLVAVAAAAAVVHLIFLWVAYAVLLRGTAASTLRTLGGDLLPAGASSVGLLALGAPANLAAQAAGLPTTAHIGAVLACAAVGYLVVLRAGFPAAARDLGAAIARVLPVARLRSALAGAVRSPLRAIAARRPASVRKT
ncbi:MAG TPA: oligosaccharide flippase family protein [Solirubrobacterales bacterium]|jgi:PST family polysaccharide transporter